MKPNISISAVLITLNEQDALPWSLGSLRDWCDEIVVVDMHSDDATVSVAEQHGARVIDHERVDAFDVARAAGVSAARNEWIFVLDADEMVHPGLREWIATTFTADPDFDLVRIPRVNIMLGRWMRNSGWWPDTLPRLFRRDAVVISERLHQGLKRRKRARQHELPADPRLAIWHFSYLSIGDYAARTNRYTDIEARQLLAGGAPSARPTQLFAPVVEELWRRYVRRRGYRDGMPGLAMALGRAWYRILAGLKIWDLPRIEGRQQDNERLRRLLLTGAATGNPPEPIRAPSASADQPGVGVNPGRSPAERPRPREGSTHPAQAEPLTGSRPRRTRSGTLPEGAVEG
jgi:glycosyltransferase involved in cell wall biosynthesis